MAGDISKDDIKKRSQMADKVFGECMAKLSAIRRKKTEVIKAFFSKIDKQKIEKIRKEIGGL